MQPLRNGVRFIFLRPFLAAAFADAQAEEELCKKLDDKLALIKADSKREHRALGKGVAKDVL